MTLAREILRDFLEKLPEKVGKQLVSVPFSWRLGAEYEIKKRLIDDFNRESHHYQRHWIEASVFEIATRAKSEHPFFGEFYRDLCIEKNLESFTKLPILNKAELQAVSLENRSVLQKGRYLTNTGGSSGQPLSFYLDSNAFAREWAHMHWIWGTLGYKTSDLKLTFRGKNLGVRPLVYNPVHNEYVVNTYCSYDLLADAIWKKTRKNQIRFIHGYPSAIYDFFRYTINNRPEIVDELRKGLKGILFGSEYPAPIYREPIESWFGVPSISWYGHSEFSILAYEVEKYRYAPMHTYGFAEAIPSEKGHRLICTGYYNRVCPFIRYDTGDLIEPEFENGLLRTFKITDGRVGDFIVDRSGQHVSLTALVFGRHHSIFESIRFIQVAQGEDGIVHLIVTLGGEGELQPEEVLDRMDLSNVDADFKVHIVRQPIRTRAGKVNLKVASEQLT